MTAFQPSNRLHETSMDVAADTRTAEASLVDFAAGPYTA